MSLKESIEKKLVLENIPHEFIRLPDGISDELAVHAQFHGIELSQTLPTLIYQTDHGLVAVQKQGDATIDNKKLRHALKTKKLRFAEETELMSLGTEKGIVPLTGLEVPFFLDQKATQQTEVYGGGGSRQFALKIEVNDLIRLNHAVVVDLTTSQTTATLGKPLSLAHRRILSGITPSGNSLHIGNYFGAVKRQIELQEQAETFYFVADLHAIITVQDRDQLEQNITGVVMDYLALGLDPTKCVFFRQSDVPAHSQLAVVLGNFISYGQMQRMHAFKDKLQKGTAVESINMGLFNYPILMAADILAYKPYGVPVGEDQRQHIELTRDIAENFNRVYGREVFELPEALIPEETGRIIGTDGERKMSKSLGNIIGIFDEPAVIEKQIMGSYTDPRRLKATDPGQVEGNPVFLYHDLINDNPDEVNDLKDRYIQGKVGDVEVKQKLIAAHQRLFEPARRRRAELAADLPAVKKILADGAQRAGAVASQTLAEVYQVLGIHNHLNF